MKPEHKHDKKDKPHPGTKAEIAQEALSGMSWNTLLIGAAVVIAVVVAVSVLI